MKSLLTLVLAALLVTGCPTQQPDPVTPSPIPPPDTDWCATMCDHLKELHCEEGEPVYNSDLPGDAGTPNQSCADNCVELQGKGFFINPKCVSDVKQCDQIESYRQREPDTCGSGTISPPAPAS